MQLDIVNMYPSINEKLVKESIKWAKSLGVEILPSEEKAILHCRESFLLFNNEQWEKTDNSRFDVGQGTYDGAEFAEAQETLDEETLARMGEIGDETSLRHAVQLLTPAAAASSNM